MRVGGSEDDLKKKKKKMKRGDKTRRFRAKRRTDCPREKTRKNAILEAMQPL